MSVLSISFAAYAKESLDFSFPDSLKQDADVVILSESSEFERMTESVLVEKYKIVFTVLNRHAEGYEQMYVNYDDLSQIRKFSCSVYDKYGKLSKKLKKSEIQDFSYYSDFTLYSDNRVMVASPLHHSYPYTIVFEYEKEYDGFIALHHWEPVPDYRVAVKSSSLVVKTPKDYPFEFKVEKEKMLELDEYQEEGKGVKVWRLSGFKAREYEYYSPSLEDIMPQVYYAPRVFEYDGHKGSNATWSEFGAFCHSLFHLENELSDNTKADLDALKAEAGTEVDLIRQVYEYMQSKTRYVGVQLGIGGFQPFPSLTVDQKGYGDCKALSYYTKTMLDYVGVNSVYTVIGSGSVEIEYEDFIANQTNHVILCVPTELDTLWLECTSQMLPFNYLSSDCTDRKALWIRPEGSELVYIPQVYKNYRLRESKMNIQADGRLLCDNKITYSGDFFDDYYYLAKMSFKELTKYLQQSSSVSGIKIQSCSAELDKERVLTTVKNEFYASDIASKAGDRLFVDLSPFAQISALKKQRSERQSKVVLRGNRTYTDRIVLEIPEGYGVEFLPPSKEENTTYAKYSFKVTVEDDSLLVERLLSVNSTTLPKEQYPEFIDYFNSVARMDNCKVSFKKL